MESRIRQFFRTPGNYPHPVLDIIERETHISLVFLSGEYAYKVKRAVRFEFVDFSTLEQRRRCCLREVELNRRFAPELYLGVEFLVDDEGTLRFGSPGEEPRAVEYVVKMLRFPEDDLFLNMLQQGRLAAPLVSETAEQIAAFHARAVRAPEYGSFEQLALLARQNFELYEGRTLPETISKLLPDARALTESELARQRDLIEHRQHTAVRLLHGDLHLKNICLFRGKPTLFDGIEFDDRYASCDPWSDFGFLLMDLRYRGRADLEAVALNRYLECTDDFEGLPLLPLSLAYRAAVRAKVSFLAAENTADEAARVPLMESSARHLELAREALARGAAPLVIAIGGLSGTGKTTLARSLAPKLGAVHIRSDVVRKHLLGIGETEPAGPEGYTSEMSCQTYLGMLQRSEAASRIGRPIILDAVFGRESDRARIADFCRARSIRFESFWCEVEPDTALDRIRARRNDASDADERVYRLQADNIRPPGDWRRIDTRDPAGAAPDLLERL